MPHAPRARRIPTETGFKLRGGPELTTIERLPVCNLLPSSWGCVSTVDREGQAMFLADAHRGDGKRFVVHADEKLSAFVELERQVLTVTFYLASIHADPCGRPMMVIEIRPHRWGWKVFGAPCVEPVFLQKDQAISYAETRACFRSGEISCPRFY
jgi:hypothetical protein